ncbi:MAG: hypothetical protein KAG94_00720 [Clostridiales bacterium]|nr:hypothetical protein [Clostridiales bacterium]
MNNYLTYWTGVKGENPKKKNNSNFSIKCYFDNDSDELINHKSNNGLVNLEVYREMIRSIKAMGYNAIDIHDQLGRAEFYLWDSYKQYWDYKADISHIEKIIDIIHEEGLKVQIPMYLAWAFNHLNEQHECWYTHKETWIETWKSYLDGPLGKGDLFLLRPRSPIYDVKYRCTCEKCKKAGTGQIMTKVFEIVEKLILSNNPQAKLICDLYAEGLDLFEDGSFRVSNKWLLLYADNGFGKLTLKKSLFQNNYKKGIYLHAGFWLNHSVMDPHLTPLNEAVIYSIDNQLTDYILVNGQSFKNFTLPLEAIMTMCDKGKEYSSNTFLHDWLLRVLGINDITIRENTIKYINDFEKFHISMGVRPAYLSLDSDVDRGFQANMIFVLYPLLYQMNKKIDPNYELPSEAFVTRRKQVMWSKEKAKEVLAKGEVLYNQIIDIQELLTNEESLACLNDQFVFPMKLLLKQLQVIVILFDYINNNSTVEKVNEIMQQFYDLAVVGSRLKGFSSWTHPKHSRMHHPIPLT